MDDTGAGHMRSADRGRLVNINHVRYFLAVCQDRNFTRAARRCGVAQPSLTKAIKRFEHELRGTLFHRSVATTSLTDLGWAIRPHLERLAQCADEALRAAACVGMLDHQEK
jgi:DNA-binding transcriptional LysR family regulator